MKRFHNMNAMQHTWKDSYGTWHETLISYDTLVCDIIFGIERVDVVLFQHWRYSPTTTRQVTRFISEVTGVSWTARELDQCFDGMDYFGFTDECDIQYLFEQVDVKFGNLHAAKYLGNMEYA